MAVATPPTKADLLEIFRRVTPSEYHQPILDDPRGTIALYRAWTQIFSLLATRIYRSAQACFYLTSALQGDQPATSGRKASFTAKVNRTTDLEQARLATIGSMKLQGSRGRLFLNSEQAEWTPYDPAPEKDIDFEADVTGFGSNLDYVADPAGLLTTQEGDADTDEVDFANQSADKTSIGGSIVPGSGPGLSARIKDSGRRETFSATDVGLYVRIDVAANAANQGRILRITGYEQPGIEDPPDSGLKPRQILVDDGPERTLLFTAQADDGGAVTDETVAANEATADDMTLTPAVPAVGDAYYFGSATEFEAIVLDISTAAVATTLTLAWEYYDGSSYTALSDLVDGTVLNGIGFGQSGERTISFGTPTNWATDTINGRTAYHVRARVTATAAVTQQPLGRQAYTLNPNPLVDSPNSEAGTVTWSVLDWSDMGFELTEIEAATGGRDDDLFLLGEERGVYQQTDEDDDQFRERAAKLADVVSPNAIRRAINRQLAPWGYRGLAFDVGAGSPTASPGTEQFEGFFFDIDALDYYGAGDAYPESPYHLPLSEQEAYGWFFVVLPFVGYGDFGIGLDDGPIVYLDAAGEYIGPALDAGFMDGYPTIGYGVYRALHNVVDTIRAGGVGFTMIRDDALNT